MGLSPLALAYLEYGPILKLKVYNVLNAIMTSYVKRVLCENAKHMGVPIDLTLLSFSSKVQDGCHNWQFFKLQNVLFSFYWRVVRV